MHQHVSFHVCFHIYFFLTFCLFFSYNVLPNLQQINRLRGLYMRLLTLSRFRGLKTFYRQFHQPRTLTI